jgi:K+/H+ antiporter YhaU regulatory subunit KhtT
MAGQPLGSLNLPRTCNVSVLALTRQGIVTLQPPDNEVLRAGDELIVAGFDGDLERIPGHTLR